MKLQGKVIKGLGEAKFWVGKINKIFKEEFQMNLFPGTLNIKLEQNYKMENYAIISPEKYGGIYDVYVKKCLIFDKEAYILRTSKNETGNGDHPLTIIEIVSDINLREKFNLKDDAEVQINI